MGRSVSMKRYADIGVKCVLFCITIFTDNLISIFLCSGFPPEKEFLEKLKGIDGVSTIETQTITNMEI